MTRGFFLTLEGGEGAGKSTLARRLCDMLQAEGRETVLTREPGGAAGAEEIRALLVTGEPGRWSALSETFLLAASRAAHVEALIAPALARGAVVICDRFADSTHAYQVAGRGLPEEAFAHIAAAGRFPTPDLTLILDADPALGLARSRGGAHGEDRFERMSAAFHARVRAAFLAIAERDARRCRVIDASASADAVFERARGHLSEALAAHGHAS